MGIRERTSPLGLGAGDGLVLPTDLRVVPNRRYGRWLSGAILLVLLALLLRALVNAELDWGIVGEFLFTGTIITGFLHTLLLTAGAMTLGLLIGLVMAIMRLSANPVANAVAALYVWFFRGVPLLLQILIWFNLALIFPTLGIPGLFEDKTINLITPFVAALLGLAVNEGAYLTEVIRGGLQAVDEGQEEASASLGLSRTQSLRHIVLPQALRVIIPPVGNETIGMLKMSSLAAVISYSELLTSSQRIYFVNGHVMELLIVAAAWYLVATSILTVGQFFIERRFSRGSRRARPPAAFERMLLSALRRVWPPRNVPTEGSR